MNFVMLSTTLRRQFLENKMTYAMSPNRAYLATVLPHLRPNYLLRSELQIRSAVVRNCQRILGGEKHD